MRSAAAWLLFMTQKFSAESTRLLPWGHVFRAQLKGERQYFESLLIVSGQVILVFIFSQASRLKVVMLYMVRGVNFPLIAIPSRYGSTVAPGGNNTQLSYQITSLSIFKLTKLENAMPVLGQAIVSMTVHFTFNSFECQTV